MLPSLVVMDVKTGKVVSTWGRSCVESNPDECVDAWLRGERGVGLLRAICTLS